MERQNRTSPPDHVISGGDVGEISEWSFSWDTSMPSFLKKHCYLDEVNFFEKTLLTRDKQQKHTDGCPWPDHALHKGNGYGRPQTDQEFNKRALGLHTHCRQELGFPQSHHFEKAIRQGYLVKPRAVLIPVQFSRRSQRPTFHPVLPAQGKHVSRCHAHLCFRLIILTDLTNRFFHNPLP